MHAGRNLGQELTYKKKKRKHYLAGELYLSSTVPRAKPCLRGVLRNKISSKLSTTDNEG